MGDDVQLVISIFAFAAAFGTAYLAARKAPSESRKADAEAGLIHANAQGAIIDDLREQIEDYRQRLDAMQADFDRRLKERERRHQKEKQEMEEEIAELRALNLKLQRRISALETKG